LLPQYAWLIPFLPLMAFFTIGLLTRKNGRASAAVSIAAITGSLLMSGALFFQRAPGAAPFQFSIPWITVGPGTGTIEMGILIDNLSAAMLAMVCFIGLLIQIYSYSYISTEIHHFPTQNQVSLSRFFAYLSLFVFSMLGLVLANNLLQIYVFWELVGVCSYFLIGFWYFKTSAAEACKKAFVVTKFADLGFLVGVLSVGLSQHTFNFLELTSRQTIEPMPFSHSLGLFLIFCGAIGKSAQFPLQIWLPDAMEGPTPVSALIHAATMVAAGVYLVARLFPLHYLAPEAFLAMAWIGAITAFLAASIAIVQNDIKRVLAYSTVSQLGYMMAGLGCGAFAAGTFHLITHAFFKALLFLGSGAVIVACHSNDIWRMGGLKSRLRYTHPTFLIGCLALAGVPPLAGFWSKDEVLAGTTAQPAIFGILVMVGFMTAFYVFRMYFIAFPGQYRGEDYPADLAGPVPPANLPEPIKPSRYVLGVAPQWTEEQAAQVPGLPPACQGALMEHVPHGDGPHVPHEVSPLMYVPLLILSLFALGLGFWGSPFFHNHFQRFMDATTPLEHHINWMAIGISIGGAALGIGLAWLLYGTDPAAGERRLRKALGPVWTFLQQKWYMDHFWAQALGASMYLWAKAVAWFDERLVDRLVVATGWFTRLAGKRVQAEQSGLVQQYLLQMVLALMVLVWALGILEPTFLWSFAQPLRWLQPGGVQP